MIMTEEGSVYDMAGKLYVSKANAFSPKGTDHAARYRERLTLCNFSWYIHMADVYIHLKSTCW